MINKFNIGDLVLVSLAYLFKDKPKHTYCAKVISFELGTTWFGNRVFYYKVYDGFKTVKVAQTSMKLDLQAMRDKKLNLLV